MEEGEQKEWQEKGEGEEEQKEEEEGSRRSSRRSKSTRGPQKAWSGLRFGNQLLRVRWSCPLAARYLLPVPLCPHPTLGNRDPILGVSSPRSSESGTGLPQVSCPLAPPCTRKAPGNTFWVRDYL